MPFSEAEKRAGSVEALLPHLRDARILARHHGLYTLDGTLKTVDDYRIPAPWWRTARDIDPATGRAQFHQVRWKIGLYELLAIGIELERAAVEALWPTKESAAPKSKRKAGPKQYEAWDDLLVHLDSLFEERTITNTEDAFHEAKNWLERKGLAWADTTIRGGIKRNRPDWPEA